MFEFDVKEIEKKLEEEYPLSSSNSAMAERILHYHPALHDVIEHWLRGEYLNFEYEGISLKQIIDRVNVPFPQALFDMDYLLKKKMSTSRYIKIIDSLYETDSVILKNKSQSKMKRRSYKWI